MPNITPSHLQWIRILYNHLISNGQVITVRDYRLGLIHLGATLIILLWVIVGHLFLGKGYLLIDANSAGQTGINI